MLPGWSDHCSCQLHSQWDQLFLVGSSDHLGKFLKKKKLKIPEKHRSTLTHRQINSVTTNRRRKFLYCTMTAVFSSNIYLTGWFLVTIVLSTDKLFQCYLLRMFKICLLALGHNAAVCFFSSFFSYSFSHHAGNCSRWA